MESRRLLEPCSSGIRAASAILFRQHSRSLLPPTAWASSCLVHQPTQQQRRGAADGPNKPWSSGTMLDEILNSAGKKSWANPKARSATPNTKSAIRPGVPPPPPPSKSTPSSISALLGQASKGKNISWEEIQAQTRKDSAAKLRREEHERKAISQHINMDISNLLNPQRTRPEPGFSAGTALSGYVPTGTDPLAPPKRPFFRLRPETGTIVPIRNNVDLGSALAILGSKVGYNKVSYMVRMQREHERPGLKRKRLRSERWKKQFSEGFKAAVKRANQLAKMGW